MDESIVRMFLSAEGPIFTTKLFLGPTDLDIEMLPSWIRVVGPTLEHLTLSFGQVVSAKVAQQGKSNHCSAHACGVDTCTAAVSLKHCRALQRLTFCAKPWSSSSSAPSNPCFWPCALEHLRSAISIKTLAAVEFVWTIGYEDTGKERATALEEVNGLLREMRYQGALMVTFSTITMTNRTRREVCRSLVEVLPASLLPTTQSP